MQQTHSCALFKLLYLDIIYIPAGSQVNTTLFILPSSTVAPHKNTTFLKCKNSKERKKNKQKTQPKRSSHLLVLLKRGLTFWAPTGFLFVFKENSKATILYLFYFFQMLSYYYFPPHAPALPL